MNQATWSWTARSKSRVDTEMGWRLLRIDERLIIRNSEALMWQFYSWSGIQSLVLCGISVYSRDAWEYRPRRAFTVLYGISLPCRPCKVSKMAMRWFLLALGIINRDECYGYFAGTLSERDRRITNTNRPWGQGITRTECTIWLDQMILRGPSGKAIKARICKMLTWVQTGSVIWQKLERNESREVEAAQEREGSNCQTDPHTGIQSCEHANI